ncbi:MAG: hypothetical protein V1917_04030 [Candidatus Gottesmanbacteria bacterium]
MSRYIDNIADKNDQQMSLCLININKEKIEIKHSKLKFRLKNSINGKTAYVAYSRSKKRFYQKLMRVNWEYSPSIYCFVSYGKSVDVFGKLVEFYNDGKYDNKKDLFQAFKAFTES